MDSSTAESNSTIVMHRTQYPRISHIFGCLFESLGGIGTRASFLIKSDRHDIPEATGILSKFPIRGPSLPSITDHSRGISNEDQIKNPPKEQEMWSIFFHIKQFFTRSLLLSRDWRNTFLRLEHFKFPCILIRVAKIRGE